MCLLLISIRGQGAGEPGDIGPPGDRGEKGNAVEQYYQKVFPDGIKNVLRYKFIIVQTFYINFKLVSFLLPYRYYHPK